MILLLLAVTAPACSDPATGGPAADARKGLLAAINAERGRAGVPPLVEVPPLDTAAQGHADALARSGVLGLERDGEARMRERLAKVGYEFHRWAESIVVAGGTVADAVGEWKSGEPGAFQQALSPEMREVGIGIAQLDGTPLYSLLFAEPRGDYFARQTAGLRDLAAMRAAVLARVNAERAKAGRRPLTRNVNLERSAQRYAEDMLARGFFAHESPEGTRPRDRDETAGYEARAVGENIAEGQFTAADVMDGWMASPGHRHNILDSDFSELGVGLALGRGPEGDQVVWVQEFGGGRR